MEENQLIGDITKQKKIVMVGCLFTGLEMITSLLKNGVYFNYFVLIDKEKAEKNSVAGYADFSPLAKQYNIPIYYAKSYDLKNENDISFFETHKFDLLIQGGWQRLFPEKLLLSLSIGSIGIHGSSEFLPKGRGRSPLNWSLIEGKKRFILQLFLMKAGADDGDIFDYEIFDINEFDDIQTLYLKNAIVTKKMILKNLPNLLNGKINLIPQKGLPSYYPKRSPEDGKIDWNKTVFEIYNFIRALTLPYPGAFTYLNDEKIFIYKAQPFDTKIIYHGCSNGEIVEIFSNGDIIVNCNSGLLLIKGLDLKLKEGQVFE